MTGSSTCNKYPNVVQRSENGDAWSRKSPWPAYFGSYCSILTHGRFYSRSCKVKDFPMGGRWNCWRFRLSWSPKHSLRILEREGVCNPCIDIEYLLLTRPSDFLKERLFGLSNPQGNHGESIKEAHFHLDNTPSVRRIYKWRENLLTSVSTRI